MDREHERILISYRNGKGYLTHINQFNIKKGLLGIDTVLIGEKTLWPFGDYHTLRKKQMIKKTILKTYI